MRHAFLIMAHQEFELLKELMETLDDERCDIFLHVDIKVKDFDPNQFKHILKKSRLFFAERLNVAWGGYSFVQCEYNLFKLAHSIENYGYYHLISGVDFPVSHREEFYDFFKEKSDTIYLSFWDEKLNKERSNRFRYYHFLQEKIGRNKNIYRFIETLTIPFQRVFVDRRKKHPEIQYKGGSNWCSLSAEACDYLVSKEDLIEDLFKNTCTCDEFFVHTIIYNSPLYKKVYENKEQGPCGNALRYIDWQRGRPYSFTLADYEELIHSDRFFARKVQYKTDEDRQLIHKLKEYYNEA